MRLLVVTQKVDATDRNLGFFVGWIEKFAEQGEIVVIANEVNADTVRQLPSTISVFSLGKENGASRLARFLRYQVLLFRHLPAVDGVFFHMCPEYVLCAHWLPKLYGKKSILWYVHKQVSVRLRLAVCFINKLFTASKESCRLRSKKVEIVGHGIDVDLFNGKREGNGGVCLLTVGRISPTKDLRTLILGFLRVREAIPDATFSIVGDPITDTDCVYHTELLREFSDKVQFKGGVPYGSLPAVYATATVFVHASRTGSMDKAVLEALASGLPVFTSSEAFDGEIPGIVTFKEDNPEDLSEKIDRAFERGGIGYNEKGSEWILKNHNLTNLVKRLVSFCTV